MNQLISLIILALLSLHFHAHAQDIYPVVYQQGQQTRVMLIQEMADTLPMKIKDFLVSPHQDISYYRKKNLKVLLTRVESEAREALNTSLWKVNQSWNEDWEFKFSRWIETEVTPDFFGTDLATDCADAIYALRWIFARNHGLPAANRIGGGHTIFTHRSVKKEWLHLPTHIDWREDQRFLAALNYLVELSYTQLLIRDTYPIAISQRALRPGRHYTVVDTSSYHNYLVHKVTSGLNGENPISLLSSTVPREFRSLAEDVFLFYDQPQAGGFRGHLWPHLNNQGRWQLEQPGTMPHYSEEQFQPGFVKDDDFSESVFDRVAPTRTRTLKDRLNDRLNSLYRRFLERIFIVEQGYSQCYPNRCAEGTAIYDAWSTPTRDQRIHGQIMWVDKFVSQHPELRWTLRLYLWNTTIQVELDHFEVANISLNDLFNTWRKQLYSSDPNESRSKRWGY